MSSAAVMSGLPFAAITQPLASLLSTQSCSPSPATQLPVTKPRRSDSAEPVDGCLLNNSPESLTCNEATAERDVYHDCYSEVPTTTPGLESESAALDESQTLPPSNERLGSAPQPGVSWQQQYLVERQLRRDAQAAVQDLQDQLAEIGRMVLCYAGGSSSGDPAAAPSREAAGKAQELPAAVAAVILQNQLLSEAVARVEEESAAEREAARLAAAVCARAAAVEDLRQQWREEKEVLERRLEQSAHMVEAMLKHSKKSSKQLEQGWQHFMNGVLSVGCLVLGAGAAGLIISHVNAAAASRA